MNGFCPSRCRRPRRMTFGRAVGALAGLTALTIVACLGAAVAAGSARAQTPKRIPSGQAPAPESSTAEQRQREFEDLRREDVAAQLALLGLPLAWQEHTLAQLLDWRDRIEAAVTLRVQHRVDVDWRLTSLVALNDMRLRASKAAELATRYGVRVDWRHYSWPALEALRRQVARLRSPPSTTFGDDDALAAPGTMGQRRPPGRRPTDPDAIMKPTFAFDTALAWSRQSARRGRVDPDAILVPVFLMAATEPIR